MEIDIDSNYNLRRLNQWLTYELSSIVLYALSWFVSFTIALMTIAAVIFTPIMLKILFQEGKYGWITFFVVIVIVPTIVLFATGWHQLHGHTLALIPLASFYFYCFLLKFVVRDWMDKPHSKIYSTNYPR